MSSLFKLLPGSPDSPPLLFLHGFLGAPSMWSDVLAKLGKTGPVALVTLPGHGIEPLLWNDATFSEVADRMTELLPFQSPALLVGYSMGGRVGLAMTLRHPERFAGAVLIGVDPGLPTEGERKTRITWEDSCIDRLLTHGLEAFVDEWEALPLFATQRKLSLEQQERMRATRLSHTPSGLAYTLATLGLGRMPNLYGELCKTSTPLHFVAGEKDTKFCAIATKIVQRSPRLTRRVIPGVGHNVAFEDPAALSEEIQYIHTRIKGLCS